ncbi:solute:Na+ symporter, SSS family [Catalinimonas alkaloidigena]|uniref:Solute:Na+ symporter, SSS family n=1 Tax=Catalinimonas alkaloidigena TaxID=1075417 RepID=A0A1G9R791_9BACT|nr:sodium:solute symporter [Catalinimonas alkaloidigena]SDM19108.1 solute:Na+ symporter, SSS family [Catalinimonas alkaloidigena]
MHYATLHWLDYVIIFLSLVVSLWIGARFAKKQQSTKDYFAASGSLPSWAIGMSLLATLISSVTFLAYPGEGFSDNWILLVQGLMVPLILVGMIWFIVPLFRRVIGLSAYEYFEKRFGLFPRLYASLAFVLAHFSKMGTVFFLLALALANMTGANTFATIWVLGIIIIVLTLMGGIEAVIWLDVIQGFMLIGGGLICLGIILFSVEGGPAAVWEIASESGKTGFGPYDWDFKQLTFWVMALNGVFYAIQKYGTDQTVVQRYLTARSDKSAIRASLMGVLLTVPLWALFMFIGTALFVFYQQQPLPEGMRPDAVFPYFITTQLPPGVTGLILAALIAAAVSSLDSDLNCLAAVGVEDYYKRLRPHQQDQNYLKVGRWIVVLSGLGAIGVASLYLQAGDEGVLGIVFTLYAIFSGGIAGIFLLGLFSRRANLPGVTIGIIACILFTAYSFLTSTRIGIGANKHLLLDFGAYNFTQHKYMLGVYSHLIVIGVGYVASLFYPKPDLDPKLFFHWPQRQAQRPQVVES